MKQGGLFPISTVKVEATYEHLSPKELEAVLSKNLPASFWTIDLRKLKENLEKLAWVKAVQVDKIWPETIKVKVLEKKAVARWGKKGLVSDQNLLFYPEPETISAELPVLYGPLSQLDNILKTYQIFQQVLTVKKLKLQALLLTESNAWIIRLSNGTVLLLGSQAPLKRLRRFVSAYESVFGEYPERTAQQVDLRYPHGMAVSWGAKTTGEPYVN